MSTLLEIFIAYPAEGAIVAGKVPVGIVSSSSEGIHAFDLFVDGKLEDHTDSSDHNWPDLPLMLNAHRAHPGEHKLTAVVTDVTGAAAEDSRNVISVK